MSLVLSYTLKCFYAPPGRELEWGGGGLSPLCIYLETNFLRTFGCNVSIHVDRKRWIVICQPTFVSICYGPSSSIISQLSYSTSNFMQVLGTPTREEIKCMNPNYTEFKFPQIKPHPWHKVCCVT